MMAVPSSSTRLQLPDDLLEDRVVQGQGARVGRARTPSPMRSLAPGDEPRALPSHVERFAAKSPLRRWTGRRDHYRPPPAVARAASGAGPRPGRAWPRPELETSARGEQVWPQATAALLEDLRCREPEHRARAALPVRSPEEERQGQEEPEGLRVMEREVFQHGSA